jgi:hypothetical protein
MHLQATMLAFSTRLMRRFLQAWHVHAHQRAGASRMLRLLLASTLAEAFDAWRAVAADKAHWRRVSLHCCSSFLLVQCMLLAVGLTCITWLA